MLEETLKTLSFWRKSSTDISSVPEFVKKQSFVLDYHNTSDPALIPTYIQFDPDLDFEIPRVKVKEIESSSSFYEHLIQEGPVTPVHFESYPHWLDPKALTEGLSFVHKHFYTIFFSHVVSLFLIVTLRPIQALLMRTTPIHNVHPGINETSPSLLWTLQLLLKIQSIYSELKELSIKLAYGDEINAVRQSMANARHNFRKYLPPLSTELSLDAGEIVAFKKFRQVLDINCPMTVEQVKNTNKIITTLNPEVALSQYDLTVLQFLSLAPLFLFPRVLGLGQWTERERTSVVHVWAVVGHAVGIRDDFNLALLASKPENATLFTQIALELKSKIVKFSFCQSDKVVFKFWKILTQNLKKLWFGALLFHLDLDRLLYFVAKHFFEMDLGKLCWKSKVRYAFHRLLVQSSRCWICRQFLNILVTRALLLSNWYYITRNSQGPGAKSMSGSRISLTRSIKWSNKDDGIAYETENV